MYTKKAHVLLFYCCVEHTHKESLFTLAREREREREILLLVLLFCGVFCPPHQRERERESVCNKSVKRITHTKVPRRRLSREDAKKREEEG